MPAQRCRAVDPCAQAFPAHAADTARFARVGRVRLGRTAVHRLHERQAQPFTGGRVMANINVKNENGGALVRRNEWDPTRWARDLLRWDPFREMASLPPIDQVGFAPDFEVKENGNGFIFKADLPGVQEKDIE